MRDQDWAQPLFHTYVTGVIGVGKYETSADSQISQRGLDCTVYFHGQRRKD